MVKYFLRIQKTKTEKITSRKWELTSTSCPKVNYNKVYCINGRKNVFASCTFDLVKTKTEKFLLIKGEFLRNACPQKNFLKKRLKKIIKFLNCGQVLLKPPETKTEKFPTLKGELSLDVLQIK